MKVVVKGLNLIKSNKYKRLIITEEDEKYKIEAKGIIPGLSLFGYEELETGNIIKSERLLVDIIEDFVNENTIKYLANGINLDSKHLNYDIVKGDRELDIKLKNKRLKALYKLIENKYCDDRLDFCEKNKDINVYNFFMHSDKSYYKRKQEKTGEYINFHLKSNYLRFSETEQEFLMSFIESKLEEKDKPANLENKTRWSTRVGYVNMGYRITCDNLVLRVYNPYNEKEASDLVKKHNKKLESEKKMQLKMEGF